MTDRDQLEAATMANVVRYVMQRSVALGMADGHAGMTVAEVETQVHQVFDEAEIDRRVTDVRTVLADHAGDNGLRYFTRVARGTYRVAPLLR